MSDFERYWLNKFSSCLEEFLDEEKSFRILEGSESLNDGAPKEEVIRWTKKAMEKLDLLVDKDTAINIMNACSCQYPKSQLKEIKSAFSDKRRYDLVHKLLQNQFELLLDKFEIDEEIKHFIIQNGWGSAGIIEGNEIIATKIPKSNYIKNYFNTDDPNERRQMYCHCPRVRDILKTTGKEFPEIYCHCGAGFYRGIWEEIIQQRVKVQILKSVLKGDDVCQFRISLPPQE